MNNKLLQIFSDVLNVDLRNLSLSSNKEQLDEWDSLASIRLVAEVEEVFKCEIPFEDIEKLTEIKDFLKYINT